MLNRHKTMQHLDNIKFVLCLFDYKNMVYLKTLSSAVTDISACFHI